MSGIFSSKPAAMPVAPVIPAVQPPAPMPDQNSAAALEAKRRAQMDIASRAGRSSTILTAPNQRAATGDYSANKLGSAA